MEFLIKWQKQPRQQALEFHKMTGWPTSANVCCHNCCHPFDGVPVPLPYSYDERRRVYLCKGNFCSWQCVKAYNIQDTLVTGKGDRNMYIALLAYKTWYKLTAHTRLATNDGYQALKGYAYTSIQPAQSRENLQMFGGPLSIQEYRRGFFGIMPPDEAFLHPPYVSIRQREKTRDGITPFSLCSASTSPFSRSNGIGTKPREATAGQKENMGMMKRRQKNTDTNTLMSSMGVIVEKKKKEHL
ncbi:FirrV-1-B14 [Feldmannia irregularis virus a]|uniref:FirrV-1-B14 n=1 Tax=Feldmannia irregularis virus a TaxID=231992 RepID=Q6XM22_9PHYC|nr:FirrV-1-B14 [Feldmannia irregularis virus a]AAR26889.1 FirrV-1-B14 [Feldmannia irregularis virus a]